MGHHGTENYDNELSKMFEEAGALIENKFPDGKLNPLDEGVFQYAITVDKGKLIIAFEKSCTWIGLNKTDVEDLIKSLTDKLKEVD